MNENTLQNPNETDTTSTEIELFVAGVYRIVSHIFLYNDKDNIPDDYAEDTDNHIVYTEKAFNVALTMICDEVMIHPICTSENRSELIDQSIEYYIARNTTNISPSWEIYTQMYISKRLDDIATLEQYSYQEKILSLESLSSKKHKDIFLIQYLQRLIREVPKEIATAYDKHGLMNEDINKSGSYAGYFNDRYYSNSFWNSEQKFFYMWEESQGRYQRMDSLTVADKLYSILAKSGHIRTDKINSVRSVADKIMNEFRMLNTRTPDQILDDTIDSTWKLNVKNGVVNLLSGSLEPHDPRYYFQSVANVTFDEYAKCPQWEKFIDDICFDSKTGKVDQSKVRMLQSMCGYCLSGSTAGQKSFVLFGIAGSGKSTLVEVLMALLTRQFSSCTTLEAIATDQFVGHKLYEKRLNICSEVDDKYLKMARIKSWISGDSQTSNEKYGAQFDYTPKAKFIILCNKLFNMDESDMSIRDRFVVILFENRYRGTAKQDFELKDRLLTELPGILNWCIKGCMYHVGNGGRVLENTESRLLTDSMIRDNNHVAGMLHTYFVKNGNMEESISLEDIEKIYKQYLKDYVSEKAVDKSKYRTQIRKDLQSIGVYCKENRSKNLPTEGWYAYGIVLTQKYAQTLAPLLANFDNF